MTESLVYFWKFDITPEWCNKRKLFKKTSYLKEIDKITHAAVQAKVKWAKIYVDMNPETMEANTVATIVDGKITRHAGSTTWEISHYPNQPIPHELECESDAELDAIKALL